MPSAPSPIPRTRRCADLASGLVLTAVAALGLFCDLGSPRLWQDEAQTALLAASVLRNGVPLGFDARNSYSQELGVEYSDDGLWKWQPWLPFYLVAGAFAVFGADTLPARLPFALCGLATVLCAWTMVREVWADRGAALASGGLLALSVPFLVLSRQARYYALASLLSLLGLWLAVRLERGERHAAVALTCVATLLFYTQSIYAGALLLSLLIHAALFERRALRRALGVSAIAALLALPWIAWSTTLELGAEKTARLLEWRDTPWHLLRYLQMVLDPLLVKGVLLAAPLLVWLDRRLRGSVATPPAHAARALLGLYVLLTLLLLALLSPLAYLRYLAPTLPPLYILCGLSLAALARARPVWAAAVGIAFLSLGSLRDFVHELTHDYAGPIDAIVSFLSEHAEPGDTVAITYGDLPVKFYTGLRVVGGLTGESLDPVAEADWIVPRRHLPAEASRRVREALLRRLAAGGYRRHVLGAPDLPFESREDPRVRPFRAPEGRPPVVVWERLR